MKSGQEAGAGRAITTSPNRHIAKSAVVAQLAVLLTTLIWGATFPSTKAALEHISPYAFLFLRFTIGTLLVAAVVAVGGRALVRDRTALRLSLIATVFLYLGYVLQTLGLRYTTASNSAFITALYVVFVPLFLRRFTARLWAAVLLAVAGLWLLVNPAVTLNVGDLMTLACAAAFAGHIIALELFIPRTEPVSMFLWQLIFMTTTLLPTMLLADPPQALLAATVPVVQVALLVTGVGATGAFAVQMWAQSVIPAQRIALIFSLEPAYAAWLAWYFLDERLAAQAWIGSLLILAGVIIGATQSTERDVLARNVAEHG